MKITKVFGVSIRYDDKGITILDSYKITNKTRMYAILSFFRRQTKYESKRSINSWIREWKAHNRLYKLGLLKKHTKDCDLEENEKWYRLVLYHIIGM